VAQALPVLLQELALQEQPVGLVTNNLPQQLDQTAQIVVVAVVLQLEAMQITPATLAL
jgi:hypothetical protein